MKQKKIGFIGLGLIGGSIAKAIRRYYPDYEIVAFDKNRETLALATQESIINVACTSIDDNFRGCNYIFLCAPVAFNTAYLKQMMPYLHDDMILTAPVKQTDSFNDGKSGDSVILSPRAYEMTEGLALHIVPIAGTAGSEKSGFANSKPILIENAYFVLTPSAKVAKKKVDAYASFVESLRALPIVLDYHEHDIVTGTISHLPHIIAASLVNFVRDTDTKDELMKTLAAGGFKDITRIASSSPTMWEHICAQNQSNISQILGNYIETLNEAKKLVDAGDSQGIYDMFDHSRNYRNSMPNGSAGPIKRAFEIYCDIPDEAGVIATIATILASNALSIKNIGIVHNREFEEGVLRIEFYDSISCEKAVALLQKHRYIVYER